MIIKLITFLLKSNFYFYVYTIISYICLQLLFIVLLLLEKKFEKWIQYFSSIIIACYSVTLYFNLNEEIDNTQENR